MHASVSVFLRLLCATLHTVFSSCLLCSRILFFLHTRPALPHYTGNCCMLHPHPATKTTSKMAREHKCKTIFHTPLRFLPLSSAFYIPSPKDVSCTRVLSACKGRSALSDGSGCGRACAMPCNQGI